MNEQEIARVVKEIESLQARLDEISSARQRDYRLVLSQDVARLESGLCRRYNKLVQTLSAAGVEHGYALKTMVEEEPEETPLMLGLFLDGAIDPRELYRPDPKPKSRSLVPDGLGGLVDY